VVAGKRKIKTNAAPWIVAEIGSAHHGDMVKADELIAAAAESGADCAKFQLIIADEILHPDSGSITLPGGATPIFQRFKALERPPEFYRELSERCTKYGVEFLCSPFGVQSAAILREIGVRTVKIASPELNHVPLLRALAGIPRILSTGVSTLSDIEAALDICGTEETVLLHCVTSYPADPAEYNLAIIPHLSSLFGVPVGVSDHSTDPILIPVIATTLGAVVIEKHFTLDKKGKGLDDPIALNPAEFRTMVLQVRKSQSMEPQEVLQTLSDRYGTERVKAVMGNGKKVLSRSEKRYYATTNRSIMAIKTIEEKEAFTTENIALLRSETNMRPGLPGQFWDLVLGRTAVCPIRNGEGINWRHFSGQGAPDRASLIPTSLS